MAAVSDDDDGVKNKELPGIEFKKSRRTKSLTGTSLASIESLSMPLVCILSYSMKLVLNFFPPPVDFGLVCASCQCQVQEVVLSADIRCSECQKRVADMMSKLNGEISVYGFLLSYLISSSCFTIALGCFSEHLARGIFEPVLPHAVLLPAKK